MRPARPREPWSPPKDPEGDPRLPVPRGLNSYRKIEALLSDLPTARAYTILQTATDALSERIVVTGKGSRIDSEAILLVKDAKVLVQKGRLADTFPRRALRVSRVQRKKASLGLNARVDAVLPIIVSLKSTEGTPEHAAERVVYIARNISASHVDATSTESQRLRRQVLRESEEG